MLPVKQRNSEINRVCFFNLFVLLWFFFRYIIDGPGSMTVFNGDKKLVDLLYTRSNTYISGTL